MEFSAGREIADIGFRDWGLGFRPVTHVTPAVSPKP